MKVEEIEEFAKNLSKSVPDYVDLTRRILSGKEDGVEFILKDSRFRWKKGPWNHGIMNMAQASAERVFPDVVKRILLRQSELEETVNVTKRENERLKSAQQELNDKLEGMIKAKNELEDHLYARFVVVLNSKKDKIRELQNELDQRNGTDNKKLEDKIYEAETDPSEDEEEEEKDFKKEKESKKEDENSSKKTKKREDKVEPSPFLSRAFSNVGIFGGDKLLKRQLSDSEGKMIDSDFEDEDRRSKRNCKSAKRDGGLKKTQKGKGKGTPTTSRESTPSKSSTSRNIAEIDRMDKTTGSVRTALNFDSGESSEDMFADDS